MEEMTCPKDKASHLLRVKVSGLALAFRDTAPITMEGKIWPLRVRVLGRRLLTILGKACTLIPGSAHLLALEISHLSPMAARQGPAPTPLQ